MSLTLFLNSLTGKIFKILPLKEKNDDGYAVHLEDYLESLLIEIIGACGTFSDLGSSVEFLTVINTMQYISQNDVSVKVCKREVFKMIDLVNKINKKGGAS
ncbi:MAG: hypothetical protein WCS17_12115 [Prevotella sp.]